MRLTDTYLKLEEFERSLGDPSVPESPLSFARGRIHDEEERFPVEALRFLYDRSIAEEYILPEQGGALTSYERFLGVGRALARRDMTVAVTCSTLVWSTLVWIGGDESQRRRHAAFLREHKSPCLAYSEEAHGADLLGGSTIARREASGYVLSGEKWPINRATRGEGFIVLARTKDGGGPRSLSLFMLEKDALPAGTFEPLPRVPTLGVRGCDISGVRFLACPIPDAARLGAEGSGLELALKGFQVTRALCASLSLGIVDTGLRTTLSLARSRRLYGDAVFSIPSVRRTFGEAFVDVILAECLSIAAMRALHVVPEQYSVWSAVVKALVPATAEEAFRRLAVVQGARFYMRDHHEWGVFQRCFRDNVLIAIFDGSTVVNLDALSMQLRGLATTRSGQGTTNTHVNDRCATLFDLKAPLPAFDPKRLELTARGADDAVQGLAACADRFAAVAESDANHQPLVALVLRLNDAARTHADATLRATQGRSMRASEELFQLARRYCLLQAGACAALLWLFNREAAEPFFARGGWLVLVLDRILRQLGVDDIPAVPLAEREALVDQLALLHDEKRMFSLIPIRLG